MKTPPVDASNAYRVRVLGEFGTSRMKSSPIPLARPGLTLSA
jgi:hypothetical protein